MRNVVVVALGLVLLTAGAGSFEPVKAQGTQELAGGWIVTGWTAPDGTEHPSPQRGLFLFTATGQYSMMYVPGEEPRATYEGETQTDAETLEAYSSFIANSGRYLVDGNTITYEAYVAKDPNYMDSWNLQDGGNAQTMTYSIDEGILTLTWGEEGMNQGMKATLRRPGEPQG